MKQSMAWSTGTPNEIGQHFVAIQVGQGAGWYDFAVWNGEQWECRPTEKVAAFMSLQDLVRQLKIEWPGEQPPLQPNLPTLSDEDLDFREI